MAERFKAQAWKACVLSKVPWVRIPLSPPFLRSVRAIPYSKNRILYKYETKEIIDQNAVCRMLCKSIHLCRSNFSGYLFYCRTYFFDILI